jgi:2,4-dienoyl-CoA reductase-like NADH-dependent reductase (Old Yellow Enzyme family)/NADPH-dependent 2,4-dienoyl-CoA reductase/sulfur reductase-like enzyme
MSASFSHLLSPGRIGTLQLRNRIFMTPMGSNLADEDGFVGERIRAYYAERAKGGAALVTMGSVSIGYPDGSSNWRQEAISDDRYLPGLTALADDVHRHGAKLCVQLHHAGLVAMNDMLAGRPVWTPSLPAAPKSGDMMDGFLEDEYAIFTRPYTSMGEVRYQVLTAQDIERLVQMYASAAERAKRAGIDAVEIHAGHGYILSSFLSPNTNRRTDEYGGTVENRARLLVDVVKGIRAAVGRDYPVWARLDSEEFLVDEGISIEDAKTTARLAQDAGLDAIHVTAYSDMANGIGHSVAHATHIPGKFVANAGAIKAAVDIPVITAGRIELEEADRLIGAGKIDFVAMGRKLLADPHLARKLAEGRRQDVRPCIYCYTCISQIYFSRSVKCAVNPETGFERELAVQPAAASKHVVVVGGGPAGMETARRLRLAGHRVTLLEASDRLGGTAQFASIAYEPNQGIVDWLKRQVGQAAIEVRLSTRATVELVRQLAPDAVVVATGAVRAKPPIPGSDRPNVFDGDEMRRLVLGQDLASLAGKTDLKTRLLLKAGAVTGATRDLALVRRASEWWMPLGQRIVIIGGELVGLELAEFLAHRGRTVAVVDDAAKLGAGLQVVRRWRMLHELKEAGVRLQPAASGIAIGDGTVSYVNRQGQTRTVAADHVIVAKGARGDITLADQLRAAGFAVHTAGDCTGVGYIEGAMANAAQIAAQI